MVLIHVTTVPETFTFFRGQIAYMKKRGIQIHGVSSPGALLEEVGTRESIPVHGIAMPRRITLIRDIKALYKLYRLFCFLKPDIVHAHTPKGGLLGVVAARLARVPVVIYGMRGLPFVTASGQKRKLLKLTEMVACRLADRTVAVSNAIRNTAISMQLCCEDKILVLAHGSGNGVDAEGRFNPHRLPPGIRENIRSNYQIPADALVLGYVGRIVRDKGIIELEAAWQTIRHKFSSIHLLLIGKIENQDPVPRQILERLKSDPLVRFVGPVAETAPFYAAMDILVLPTYREGFPNTPLEAAAMELPVVATDVDGCPETLSPGITGLLVPPRDSLALTEAISELVVNRKLRVRMGQAGRERVLRYFKPDIIWEALYQNYQELIELHRPDSKSPF